MLSLVSKYKEEYIKKYKDAKLLIKRVEALEERLGIPLLQWTENELGQFLESLHTPSPATLNNRLIQLRKFVDYITTNENLPDKKLSLGDRDLVEFIDKKALLRVTLSVEQYTYIKNHLTINEGGKEYNTRDKLVFELAWCGLTNTEIRLLKDKDIEFQYSEFNKRDDAVLHLPNRIIRVEDAEVVDDIKRVMGESEHIVIDKNGIKKYVEYRPSPCLIKPTSFGHNSRMACVNNVSQLLKAAIKSNDIRCAGIDVEKLTVEDIKRSRLIYMLSCPEYDVSLVGAIYGFKNENSLFWLRKIAQLKYREN